MILVANGLSKVFNRRGKNFNAVKDVEFFIWSADFNVIFGESGSGKSTLLSIVGGVSTPDSGSVVLDGEELVGLGDNELSKIRNKHIGFVPQNAACLPNFTVLENVLLPTQIDDGIKEVSKELQERALQILQSLGIETLAESFPSELSGGELRRVAIARALINNPELLIADEPTSNLDEENGLKIFELFHKLSRKGTAVIVATHDLRATRFGDRLFVMKNGSLCPLLQGDYGDL